MPHRLSHRRFLDDEIRASIQITGARLLRGTASPSSGGPGEKPKPASWPPKNGGALKQPVVCEDGKL